MIAPPHFLDDGYAGSWLDALLFPHRITILDDAPRQLTEPDGVAHPPVTVPRREAADAVASCRIALPARVSDSNHDQPDSPERK